MGSGPKTVRKDVPYLQVKNALIQKLIPMPDRSWHCLRAALHAHK
jgi:hypothetical protein